MIFNARSALLLFGILALGCGAPDGALSDPALPLDIIDATPSPTPEAPTEALPTADRDGDGYTPATGDCDDFDADIHPDAPERCGDDRDNNCDRFVDEPSAVDALPYYLDEDGDGHGDPGRYLVGCQPHAGFVPAGDDCDDDDPQIYPGADEFCGDEVDFNCDGRVGDGEGRCD